MSLPGSPPGGEAVTLAYRWIRSIAVEHPWVRIPPHQWAPGDLLITALPDPADGPVAPLAGWSLLPDSDALLAYRIATGGETEQVLLAIRFTAKGDDGPEPVEDPDIDPDPEP